LTNREITERIIGDLNELIDKRGNTELIPQLVAIRKFKDEIVEIEREIDDMLSDEIDGIIRDADGDDFGYAYEEHREAIDTFSDDPSARPTNYAQGR
jgi:hypothetical protein